MSPTKIASIAVVGTGVVGGGIGTAYAFAPNETKSTITMLKKLTDEGLTVLSDSTETRWLIKLHTYNNEIKSSNTEISLGGAQWSNLKSWCEGKLNSIFEERSNKIYEGMKVICTVPSNKEKLNSLRKTFASSPEDWSKIKTAYDKARDNEIISGIQKNTNNQEEIKEWCETTLKEEYEAENKGKYALVAKWCVNDPA